MFLLRAFAGIAVVLLIVFLITQILVPMFRGTPLFPMLRKDEEKDLVSQLHETEQDIVEERLRMQIKAKQDELHKLQAARAETVKDAGTQAAPEKH